ncbi:sensor histidine kinase [Amycolatopsis suaedae]|uniref:histidine kinase n=1 Tax=Amycolatopsis suaedae TaxID=2510978 RepID=A0A4V2ELG9_9PSEU|nr:HAMP domain-containing sensor histidine kinase [Amycolatopsis suaedae]RZQ61525.1 HAMP domain-containing histidine kinase [Amycolatopsis suaedae]
MTLRTRLVLTVLGLLSAGLVVALGATFGALQDWKGRQDDDVLSAVGRQVEATGLGDTGAVWQRLAADGVVPSLLQLRGPDGRLLRSSGPGGLTLPDPLPAELWPDRPGGERFAEPADGWLVRTSWAGQDILVVGARTDSSDELLDRTRNVVLISGGAALLAVALLSWRLVRRELRPLAGIAEAARHVGPDELSRRVPHARPGTEVGTVATALNGMLDELQAAFHAREASEERLRRFVGDASHELRTPIATIRGHAELFRRGAADRPEDLAKVLSRIESEAARMGVLVDELLLLARLDQGRPLRAEPVELTGLAADAVADALATAPGRDLRLEHDGPVTVTGDADRLRQLLANLLDNVLRHTPPEASAVVRVRAGASVEVADTGPGIDPDEADRVFERFHRGVHSGHGSGLGLSIVAAVAAAHGGSASVTATPGGGATVRVLLPAAGRAGSSRAGSGR